MTYEEAEKKVEKAHHALNEALYYAGKIGILADVDKYDAESGIADMCTVVRITLKKTIR